MAAATAKVDRFQPGDRVVYSPGKTLGIRGEVIDFTRVETGGRRYFWVKADRGGTCLYWEERLTLEAPIETLALALSSEDNS